jgi:hypothetical protein
MIISNAFLLLRTDHSAFNHSDRTLWLRFIVIHHERLGRARSLCGKKTPLPTALTSGEDPFRLRIKRRRDWLW